MKDSIRIELDMEQRMCNDCRKSSTEYFEIDVTDDCSDGPVSINFLNSSARKLTLNMGIISNWTMLTVVKRNINSTHSNISTYNGFYDLTGIYNSKAYYVGNGDTVGYVYYNGNEWCLSSSLGGSCILKGASPCTSECPDISSNYFTEGDCPTPTPPPG